MYKIELKRIHRINQPAYHYDTHWKIEEYYYRSEFTIEFKLLFKLEESDKKELNSFFTRELLSKGIT